MPNEFINHQVDKLASLEDEERFHFSKFTPISQVRVAVKAFYHEVGHHGRLEANPSFLDVDSYGTLIVLVILVSEYVYWFIWQLFRIFNDFLLFQ